MVQGLAGFFVLAADVGEKASSYAMVGSWLGDLALFALKVGLVVVAGAILIGILVANVRGSRGGGGRVLTVSTLNDALEDTRDSIRAQLVTPKLWKKAAKLRRKLKAQQAEPDKRIFVMDFEGDITASETRHLRTLVSALLGIATAQDEVVIRLDSPGGLVPQYGLAASQLARLRAKGIPLTVCVDRIAASGGYLMACEAQRIVAAPFAVLGSIGVVAPVPNLHRLLERYGVDYEEVTAGRFKRTVSLLGEISPEGREKFKEQLEEVHDLFKDAVKRNREQLDMDVVATGEYWFGTRAIELGLVDEVQTSDDYLLERVESAKILHLKLEDQGGLRERLGLSVEAAFDRTLTRWFTRLWAARFA